MSKPGRRLTPVDKARSDADERPRRTMLPPEPHDYSAAVAAYEAMRDRDTEPSEEERHGQA